MSTLIIGFGYKARRGKNSACEAIVEARGKRLNIRQYAFADALRDEINEEFSEFRPEYVSDQAAMTALCVWAGVPYDPNAVADATYPYGKQRALLQYWGTEYRRAQDQDYWVRKTEARIHADAPDVALISDMRMFNEFELVKASGYAVRIDRPGFEIDDGAHHISETMLDAMPDESWSHILVNKGDIENLQQDALDFFDRATAHLFKEEEAVW